MSKSKTINLPVEKSTLQYLLYFKQYQTQIPGFRKGKAPEILIMKKYQNEIYQQATNIAINNYIGEQKEEEITKVNSHKIHHTMNEEERKKYAFMLEISYEYNVKKTNKSDDKATKTKKSEKAEKKSTTTEESVATKATKSAQAEKKSTITEESVVTKATKATKSEKKSTANDSKR